MSTLTADDLREGIQYLGRDGNVRRIDLCETGRLHYTPTEHVHRRHIGTRFVCSPEYFAQEYAACVVEAEEVEA